MSSDQTTTGGPPVAREIVVPALVGIITSIVTDAVGDAPTAVQLVVATALGGGVWWLLAGRTRARMAGPATPADEQYIRISRRTVRRALLVAAAIALVGVGVVAGLAIEWRPTALRLTAWLLALMAFILVLPRMPPAMSRLGPPLAAAGIGCAVGLTLFELGVVGRFALLPPQPPPATVSRQLSTPDGLTYTMRAIGDFPLVETGDERLAVHVRWATRENAGRTEIVTTAVAVRIGDVVVSVDGDTPDRLRINGDSTAVPAQGVRAGQVTVRSAGGRTEISAGRLRVVPSVQGGVVSRIDLNIPADYRGQLRGLLGDFDGDPADDLQLRNGTVVRHSGDPASVQEVIDGRFATSWRLRPEQGLLG